MSEFNLSAELADFYKLLKQGGDVSPAYVLCLEAQLELLMQQGIIRWQTVQQEIEKVYQSVYAKPVSDLHWQWCEDDKSLRLPYRMQIAPVTKA